MSESSIKQERKKELTQEEKDIHAAYMKLYDFSQEKVVYYLFDYFAALYLICPPEKQKDFMQRVADGVGNAVSRRVDHPEEFQ